MHGVLIERGVFSGRLSPPRLPKPFPCSVWSAHSVNALTKPKSLSPLPAVCSNPRSRISARPLCAGTSCALFFRAAGRPI